MRHGIDSHTTDTPELGDVSERKRRTSAGGSNYVLTQFCSKHGDVVGTVLQEFNAIFRNTNDGLWNCFQPLLYSAIFSQPQRNIQSTRAPYSASHSYGFGNVS